MDGRSPLVIDVAGAAGRRWGPSSRTGGHAMADTLYFITRIAFVVAWVIGAYLVGVTTGRRGFQPLAWGLVSLVLSPVIGFVALTLVTPGSGPRTRE